MSEFSVYIEKGYLSFSAAHFLVFGKKCERLHGHNYAVAVELEGDLDEIGYVFDFTELKKLAAEECERLDHRLLLPAENENLDISESDGEVTVIFGEKRFVFPLDDVVFVPERNISAELLAMQLCKRIAARLAGAAKLTALTIRVDEAPGQSAYYRLEL